MDDQYQDNNSQQNRVAILNNSDDTSSLSRVVQIQRDSRVANGLERRPARKAILQRLAELDLREKRRGELQAAIATIDAESDKSVVRHAKSVMPLQKELRNIESQLVESLASGGKADSKLESKRAKCIDQISALNAELETVSEACQQRRQLLERERGSAKLVTASRGALRRELFKHGPPALLDKHGVATSTLAWANNRVIAAKRGLFESQALGTERRRRSWELELAEAEKLKVAAEGALEELYAQIIAGG